MEEQFIVFDRDFVNWQWYTDANTMRVFTHLLVLSIGNNKTWSGNRIPDGQCVTSVINLSIQLALTVQQVRTSLRKLKRTDDISIVATNKFSRVTIVEWDHYSSTLL